MTMAMIMATMDMTLMMGQQHLMTTITIIVHHMVMVQHMAHMVHHMAHHMAHHIHLTLVHMIHHMALMALALLIQWRTPQWIQLI